MRVVAKDEALELLSAHTSAGEPFDCLICALSSTAPTSANFIASNQDGVVVLNRFARRCGHLMVIARNHVEHIHDLPWPVYASLQRLAYEASLALTKVLEPARVFCASLGSPTPLPNSYPHFHIHVIPVHETDDRARPARVFSWSEGVVIYEEAEAAELSGSIRAAWADAAC